MLRNRSRAAVSSKQTLMADQSPKPSPTQKPIPSFFGSPTFKALTTKTLFDSGSTISPTSILDTKPFFPYKNPFGYDLNQHPKSPKVFSENKQTSPNPVGLALIDNPVESNNSSEKCKKTVLFATNLRVQIPPPSPTDFGMKTRNPQFHPNSGTPAKDSPQIFKGIPLPVSEMELSEDYTCVILHGPQPKTTHIFDNCIVGSYFVPPINPPQEPQSFLSHCFTCKKNLEQENDIYIYRGEKGFCSQECRYQEMVSDGLGK